MGAIEENKVGPSDAKDAQPTLSESAEVARIRDLLIYTIAPLIRAIAILAFLLNYWDAPILYVFLNPLEFVYNISIINLNFNDQYYSTIILIISIILLFLIQHIFTLFQSHIL